VTAAALSLCLLTLAGTSRALTGWLPLLWTGRASRRRFWSMVPLAALAHLAALLLWGLSAALVLRWRLGASLEVPEVIRVVAVASTPMLLAWLGLFVHWYEEPALRRQFGAEYEAYIRAVPAWWPRLRPWRGGRDVS
jgi:protein-S-isoprenylcysteine O-methyltransferase Ste14